MPRCVPASLVLALALLAACGTAAPAATPTGGAGAKPAPAPALKHVVLRLSYLLGNYQAPAVLAKTKGYYRDAGFDVNIEPGKGSASTVELVSNGSDAFGLADAGTTVLLASKGAPVKVVAVVLQRSPFMFIVHRQSQVLKSPRDLLGRTIISFPGSSEYSMLGALTEKYGISRSRLKFLLVQAGSGYTAFAKDPGSVLLGYYPDDYEAVLKLVPTAKYSLYSDFGFTSYSGALITSDALIKNHPNEVRRFVAATLKGYQAALADPKATVAAAKGAFKDTLVSLDGIRRVLPMLHTPGTKGRPIGWMAKSDWQNTITLLRRYGGMKASMPATDFYTNQFISGTTSQGG